MVWCGVELTSIEPVVLLFTTFDPIPQSLSEELVSCIDCKGQRLLRAARTLALRVVILTITVPV